MSDLEQALNQRIEKRRQRAEELGIAEAARAQAWRERDKELSRAQEAAEASRQRAVALQGLIVPIMLSDIASAYTKLKDSGATPDREVLIGTTTEDRVCQKCSNFYIKEKHTYSAPVFKNFWLLESRILSKGIMETPPTFYKDYGTSGSTFTRVWGRCLLLDANGEVFSTYRAVTSNWEDPLAFTGVAPKLATAEDLAPVASFRDAITDIHLANLEAADIVLRMRENLTQLVMRSAVA